MNLVAVVGVCSSLDKPFCCSNPETPSCNSAGEGCCFEENHWFCKNGLACNQETKLCQEIKTRWGIVTKGIEEAGPTYDVCEQQDEGRFSSKLECEQYLLKMD